MNLKEELFSYIETFKSENLIINNNVSDDFDKVIIEDIEDFKEIIRYILDYLKNKKDKLKVDIDVNCMKYEGYAGLYLSVMTRDIKNLKDTLFVEALKELVDNVEGQLLIDNSEKGIVLLIDFAKEAIIEE